MTMNFDEQLRDVQPMTEALEVVDSGPTEAELLLESIQAERAYIHSTFGIVKARVSLAIASCEKRCLLRGWPSVEQPEFRDPNRVHEDEFRAAVEKELGAYYTVRSEGVFGDWAGDMPTVLTARTLVISWS